MEWSLQAYRLDEIERNFELPCVVRVNEGYYSETDAEGFSQGDIMSIDSQMLLHKVAANFATDEKSSELFDPDYVELENEILVPLNYKGKLKVLRDIKNYENFRELANDLPRYAKARQNLGVTTEQKTKVTIQAGTIIELDRIIPVSMAGASKDPDKLVIKFEHSGRPLEVGVPVSAKGKFRTEPDDNEYTIKEAIDRYKLPQVVRFLDDKIKRVYTQNLLEGIENMRTITDTLRLNRLVAQKVFVGHYKALDEAQAKDTERFRQRTLVVIPVDNPEIREIEVNVLQGDTDDVYERVFLVRNVSNTQTEDIVDGSLYVDFAMTPRIKIISHEDSDPQNEDEKPPPRPPKPKHLSASLVSRPASDANQARNPPDEDEDDSYIIPDPPLARKKMPPKVQKRKQPTLTRSISVDTGEAQMNKAKDTPSAISPVTNKSYDYASFNLADIDFSTKGSHKSTLEKKSSKGLMTNLRDSLQKTFRRSREYIPTRFLNKKAQENPTAAPSEKETSSDDHEQEQEEDANLYAELDEKKMEKSFDNHIKSDKEKHLENRHQKPTAYVQPSSSRAAVRRKLFTDLNQEELVDRLNACGLKDFASFCKKEKLNGSFFKGTSTKTLQDKMNLKGIVLAKFIQMRDENWVPT